MTTTKRVGGLQNFGEGFVIVIVIVIVLLTLRQEEQERTYNTCIKLYYRWKREVESEFKQ